MGPFPLYDNHLVLPNPNAEASLIHIPDIFGRNALFGNDLLELAEVLSHDGRLFGLLAVGIELPLQALEVAISLEEAGCPVRPNNRGIRLFYAAGPRS